MNKVFESVGYKAKRLVRYLLVIGMMSSMLFPFTMGQASSTLTSTLCVVVNTVKSIIGILALLMFILGGVMYGIAYLLPAAGNLRSSTQGWGMGMIMAGFIAFIIYLIAGYVINILIGFANNGNTSISGVLVPSC